MSISREQVADLQPGDVVELAHAAWPEGSTIRGPLYQQECSDGLYCCGFQATNPDGGLCHPSFWREFTVVSRAPRPLYVNHPRTKPVDGDIARDRDGDAWRRQAGMWLMAGSTGRIEDNSEYAPLTLLWNGETGQAVQ